MGCVIFLRIPEKAPYRRVMLLARYLPFLALLIALPGCKPKLDAPKDSEIRTSLQSAFPTFELGDLKTEIAPRGEPGVVEISCKVSLRSKADHYVVAFERSTDLFRSGPAVGFTAECVKRRILPAAANYGFDDRERAPEHELQNTFRPCFEAVGEPTLLKVKTAAGATLEVYGRMLAKKFVDRWDFAPFEPQRELPDFGQPRTNFEGKTLVMDTPEYEEAVRSVAAEARRRAAAIEGRDAMWNSSFGMTRTFCGMHEGRPLKITISPASEEIVKIEFTSLTGKGRVRTATIPRRAAAKPKQFNDDAQAYYQAVPKAALMQPLTYTNDYDFGASGVFGDTGKRAFDPPYYFAFDSAMRPRLIQGGKDTLLDVRECPADTTAVPSQPAGAPIPTSSQGPQRVALTEPAAPVIAPQIQPSASTLAKTARAHAIIQRRAPGTPADAIKLYGEAAVEGDPDAMVNFAHLLRSGKYGVRDLEMAKKLYRRAGELGNVEAKLALDTLERTGR